MTQLTEPIHTATINGRPLRFFRAPGNDLHLPWHSVDDLYEAMGLPGEERRRLLERTGTFSGGSITRVETVGGQVVIASHSVAQDAIGAAMKASGIPNDFQRQYGRAATVATSMLCGKLSRIESLQLTIMAARNTLRDGL